MQVYPVLDLMGGVVVRGVAGDRDRYRPICSGLATSSRPLDGAGAIRKRFDLHSLYVADLDSIAGEGIDRESLGELVEDDFRLLVDAGVRSKEDAVALLELGDLDVIAALETVPSPRVLRSVIEAIGEGRVIFSLDMKRGQVLGSREAWPAGVDEVASVAGAAGVRRMVVLDLAAVGVGGGTPHLDICRRWKAWRPELEIITGGGVRGVEDLCAMAEAGVDGALVASALHDGRLRREDIGV